MIPTSRAKSLLEKMQAEITATPPGDAAVLARRAGMLSRLLDELPHLPPAVRRRFDADGELRDGAAEDRARRLVTWCDVLLGWIEADAVLSQRENARKSAKSD